MSIAWEICNLLVAGIPAYLITALIFQIFNPEKDYFKAFGIYQLLIEPITKGDPKKLLTGKLPEIVNFPLYPIFLIFLLGAIGYGMTDIMLDNVPNIKAKDSESIYRIYSSNKELVSNSNYKSPIIKDQIDKFYSSKDKDIKSSKQIYEYHKEWLRSEGKFYVSGCGESRILVRCARQLLIYFFILLISLFMRLIYLLLAKRKYKLKYIHDIWYTHPEKMIENEYIIEHRMTEISYLKKLTKQRKNHKLLSSKYILVCMLPVFLLLFISFVSWGIFNDNYYEKVIMTYHIESSINQEK